MQKVYRKTRHVLEEGIAVAAEVACELGHALVM
jgi:hypothetical protein